MRNSTFEAFIFNAKIFFRVENITVECEISLMDFSIIFRTYLLLILGRLTERYTYGLWTKGHKADSISVSEKYNEFRTLITSNIGMRRRDGSALPPTHS